MQLDTSKSFIYQLMHNIVVLIVCIVHCSEWDWVSFWTVHHTHTNTGLIKYAATLPNQPQRCSLTDYFNNYNFSKLK
jgi:hypothetical protein